MDEIFVNIYKFGVYYYPAYRHYEDDRIEVGCDKCGELDIPSCIGWKDYDICLKCMAEIEEDIEDD